MSSADVQTRAQNTTGAVVSDADTALNATPSAPLPLWAITLAYAHAENPAKYADSREDTI